LQDETETVTGSALKVIQEEEISLSKTEAEVTLEASPSPDITSNTKNRTVTGSAIIAASGIQTTNMEYYADGLRASKYTDAGSVKYVYDLSGYLVAEAKNSSTITANYVWGPDRVLAKKETGGGEYYYLYNGHGDVVQIVDRNGNVVNNYKYDEWGNILESNETISNPFKYAGEVYDEETGLYYLRARYYDPALGRFTNEDTVEGQVNNPLSMNLYTYCYNNPLLYTDPTGNTPRDFFTGLANALDDNITSGALRWVLGKMLNVNQSYQYDNAVDYYAGRVTGDILSMVGGSSSIVSGLGTIVASVLGGGAITVSSGGILVVGGGAIVVEGVIGGTAQATYGGTIKNLNGQTPTRQEAIDLIKESGGTVNRIEGPHEYPNPHNFNHINYTTATGQKGTIKIKQGVIY